LRGEEEGVAPGKGWEGSCAFEGGDGAFSFDQIIVCLLVKLEDSWIICELDIQVRFVFYISLPLLQNRYETSWVRPKPIILLEDEARVF